MPRKWRFRIVDILACIEKIETYTTDMDRQQFAANDLVIDAVLRNLKIIGGQ